ncbi:hypothetical protein [Pannonibacter tanglangensis]|uniref:Uncharacterized protein n=1 Tax=Pannonibacter tanglangensis TaxID=2750084 RepID=A0ABW9ZCR4_9HYPH|nr:hypothetical protein [Pannonibacter sp. XCT-34]NBN62296.1 hypothetical protein [Pannonibacter sp. XCT-34]
MALAGSRRRARCREDLQAQQGKARPGHTGTVALQAILARVARTGSRQNGSRASGSRDKGGCGWQIGNCAGEGTGSPAGRKGSLERDCLFGRFLTRETCPRNGVGAPPFKTDSLIPSVDPLRHPASAHLNVSQKIKNFLLQCDETLHMVTVRSMN